ALAIPAEFLKQVTLSTCANSTKPPAAEPIFPPVSCDDRTFPLLKVTMSAELKAASASLVLAMAAVENGDWPAAEQGVIDAQQHSDVAMGEIRSKLCEPPTPVEQLEPDSEGGAEPG